MTSVLQGFHKDFNTEVTVVTGPACSFEGSTR
jgi:hypothetical protein